MSLMNLNHKKLNNPTSISGEFDCWIEFFSELQAGTKKYPASSFRWDELWKIRPNDHLSVELVSYPPTAKD